MPIFSPQRYSRLQQLLCAGCIAAGALTFFLTSGSEVNQPEPDSALEYLGQQQADLNFAQVHWTAEQVVQKQVDALRRWQTEPSKMVECFSLASPDNRSLTGPVERFAHMTQSPAYAPLSACKDWQLGSTVGDAAHAEILVTTIASDGSFNAYRFELSRQSAGAQQGCWLTDAVLPLTQVAFGEDSSTLGAL